MQRSAQLLSRFAITFGLALLVATSPTAGEVETPGWGGADISGATRLARESGKPMLVMIRQPHCRPCDDMERLLTEDPEVVPLTRPFIRLRANIHDPAGKNAAARLKVQIVPTVLLLGPGGMEASRRERDIGRPWLIEELQVVAFRHTRQRVPPSPTEHEILSSLALLDNWGDLEGAVRLRTRLASSEAPATTVSVDAPTAPSRPVRTRQDVERLLRDEDEPARLRQIAFDVARWLEVQGDPELALFVLARAVEAIGPDPTTHARAGFLASRQLVALEPMREALMTARRHHPDSVPQLLALARVAEASQRLYQAYHAIEAAALYAPDDAWIALELYRLQLLVHLKGRQTETRDPL